MMGLVIFGLLAGYLAIAVAGTMFAVRIAGAGPSSARQRWTAGIVVGLIFYLIPFWDWIPTVIAHKYYCATEAKFEVFKTVEQWKTENLAILPILRYDPHAKPVVLSGSLAYPLNQRVVEEADRTDDIFLSVTRYQSRVIDLASKEVLATFVDFRTGYAALGVGGAGAWKFWLKQSVCDEGENGFRKRYASYSSQMAEIGRKRP